MGPDHKQKGEGIGHVIKRAKSVMSLECKIKVLDELADGKSKSAVARQFGVNESTIRSIKSCEKAIRTSVASGTNTSLKVSYVARDPNIEKMEKALNIWMEDQAQKKMPVNIHHIRDKAKRIYRALANKSGADPKKFQASRGWYENYKKRYYLRDVKVTKNEELAPCEATLGKVLIEVINDSTVADEISQILAQVEHSDDEKLDGMGINKTPHLVELQSENLGNEDLREPNASSSNSEEDKKDNVGEKTLITLANINELLTIASDLTNKALEVDPFMERSLTFKKFVNDALWPYKELQRNLQSIVTMPVCHILKVEMSASEESNCEMSSEDNVNLNLSLT